MDFLSVREFRASSDTLRQVRVFRLFNNLRTEAEKRGFLSEEEIEDEIQTARIHQLISNEE